MMKLIIPYASYQLYPPICTINYNSPNQLQSSTLHLPNLKLALRFTMFFTLRTTFVSLIFSCFHNSVFLLFHISYTKAVVVIVITCFLYLDISALWIHLKSLCISWHLVLHPSHCLTSCKHFFLLPHWKIRWLMLSSFIPLITHLISIAKYQQILSFVCNLPFIISQRIKACLGTLTRFHTCSTHLTLPLSSIIFLYPSLTL